MNGLTSKDRVVSSDGKTHSPKLDGDEKVLQMFAPIGLTVTKAGADTPTNEGTGALYVTDK